MNHITVRCALPDDYDVIGRLLCEISSQHREGRPDLFAEASTKYDLSAYLALLKDDREVVFSACTEDGTVVGYMICKLIEQRENPVLRDMKTLYIDDLCVDRQYRSCHVGQQLMAAAEEYAKKLDCYNVTLNVWEFNEGARLFYEKQGYETQRRFLEKIL